MGKAGRVRGWAACGTLMGDQFEGFLEVFGLCKTKQTRCAGLISDFRIFLLLLPKKPEKVIIFFPANSPFPKVSTHLCFSCLIFEATLDCTEENTAKEAGKLLDWEIPLDEAGRPVFQNHG